MVSRRETTEDTKPQVMMLSLFEALDGGANDVWRAPAAGQSESSFSEGTPSSECGSSPRCGDEHPAAQVSKGWLRVSNGDKLEGRQCSESQFRRRDRVDLENANGRALKSTGISAAIIASAQRPYGKNEATHINIAASESPVRGRGKDFVPEQPVLAVSSSPVRARVGPRGIMSTDAFSFAAKPSLKTGGDASSRGVGTDAASRVVPAFTSGGDASTRVPPHSQTLPLNLPQTLLPLPQPQIAAPSSGMAFEPCSPCVSGGGNNLGIMSTTPQIPVPVATCSAQNGAPVTPFVMTPNAPDFVPASTSTQNPMHETDVLISMFGASSLPRDKLAATLLAAQPEVYED